MITPSLADDALCQHRVAIVDGDDTVFEGSAIALFLTDKWSRRSSSVASTSAVDIMLGGAHFMMMAKMMAETETPNPQVVRCPHH